MWTTSAENTQICAEFGSVCMFVTVGEGQAGIIAGFLKKTRPLSAMDVFLKVIVQHMARFALCTLHNVFLKP